MDVPFLRGLCISRSELTQVVPLDLQIEGGEKGLDLGAGLGGRAPAEAAVAGDLARPGTAAARQAFSAAMAALVV